MAHLASADGFVHNPHQLNIPAIEELAKLPQWVCWRREKPKGKKKPTKVPYQPDGRLAKSSSRSTWSTYQECYQSTYLEGKFNGIGFVFTKEDEYVGIDLDDCIDKEGNLTKFASDIVELIDSYTEISPTGTGLHIICKGNLPQSLKTTPIEMYTVGRYFCVTGQSIHEDPKSIRFAGPELKQVYEKHKQREHHSNGKIEYDLPDEYAALAVKFPWKKWNMLLEADADLKKAWEGKRSGDLSADVMSCMVMVTKLNWPVDEIAALYIQFYLQHGRTDKLERQNWQGFVLSQIERAKAYAESGRSIELAELDDHADEEGALAAVSKRLGIEISEVIQVGDVRSQWYVTAGGVKFCVGTTTQLLTLDNFEARLFEVTGHIVPPMKKAHWKAIVQLLAKEREQIDADESTEFGVLQEALNDYLIMTPPEEPKFLVVQASRPILKDEKVWINQTAFGRYLAINQIRTNGLTVSGWLKSLGFGNKNVTAWDDERKNQTGRSYWQTPFRDPSICAGKK